MIYLKQCDPRWGSSTIGNSSSTICRWGCTITALSMLSDYFKCYHNPDWMAKNLRFLVDKVIWQSVTEKTCFKFRYRYYTANMPVFERAMKSAGMGCLLQVNNNHWVVGVRKSIIPFSTWWMVIDPLTGGKNWYKEANITGGATFQI